MKLNATYTLLTDANGSSSVDPAYLAPTFDLLSDDVSTFTSTTKIIAKTSTALTYVSALQSHTTTGSVGISMNLGSLKTVKSLKIKGSVGTNFNTESAYSVLDELGYPKPLSYSWLSSSGVAITDSSYNSSYIINFDPVFKPGDTGAYASNGDLSAAIVPQNVASSVCSSSLSAVSAPTNAPYTPFFSSFAASPSYKIQYSITGSAYLDFSSVNIPGITAGTVLNAQSQNYNLDLNLDMSSLGPIKFVRILYTGSLIQPRTFGLHLTNLSKPGFNAFGGLRGPTTPVGTSAGSFTDALGKVSFILPTNTGYINAILYKVDMDGFGSYPTGGFVTEVKLDTVSRTPLSSNRIVMISGNDPVYLVTFDPINVPGAGSSSLSRTLTVTIPGTNQYVYYNFVWAGQTTFCVPFSIPASNVVSTVGLATNNIVLSEFYGDDGVIPATVTFNSGAEDRTLTITGSTLTLNESWSVTSGTTSWIWEKQEAGSSTWTNVSSASGTGTSASLILASSSSADSGDKYRVVVSSSDGGILGRSRITTVATQTPIITINSAVLPSVYQLGDPPLVLSVAASVSPSQTLTYQWQKKVPGSVAYVNISSVSPTLTIPTADLDIEDSGTSYKVVVSSAGATDVSREVTIVVTQPLPTLIIDALIDNAPSALFNNIVEEGQTLKLNILTKNISSNILYWKITNNPVSDTALPSGGTASGVDMDGGVLGGALNLSSSSSSTDKTVSLALVVFKDNLTEGNELLQIEFYTSSNYSLTSLLGRSSIFTIKDTSTGTQPAPSSTPSIPIDKCFEIGFKNLITKTPTRTQTPTPTPTNTRTPAPTNTRTPRPTPPPTNEPTRTPPASPTPTITPSSTRPIIDCLPGFISTQPSCPECMTAVIVGRKKVIVGNGIECWDWIWDCVYIPDCEPTATP